MDASRGAAFEAIAGRDEADEEDEASDNEDDEDDEDENGRTN